jgi:hypothetical protein
MDELPSQTSRKQFRASKQLSNHFSNAANIFRTADLIQALSSATTAKRKIN